MNVPGLSEGGCVFVGFSSYLSEKLPLEPCTDSHNVSAHFSKSGRVRSK